MSFIEKLADETAARSEMMFLKLTTVHLLRLKLELPSKPRRMTKPLHGIDSIQAEMLKTDINTAAKILTDLFTTIWTKDGIPVDWKKGLLSTYQRKATSKIVTAGEG